MGQKGRRDQRPLGGRRAKRAEGEKPSPEQVKALALRMAEQRERAAEDPTQDMNRPEPSGDEPLDLSEPEDLGESGPFEERTGDKKGANRGQKGSESPRQLSTFSGSVVFFFFAYKYLYTCLAGTPAQPYSHKG